MILSLDVAAGENAEIQGTIIDLRQLLSREFDGAEKKYLLELMHNEEFCFSICGSGLRWLLNGF